MPVSLIRAAHASVRSMLRRSWTALTADQQANARAALVAVGAMGVLWWEEAPKTAGSDAGPTIVKHETRKIEIIAPPRSEPQSAPTAIAGASSTESTSTTETAAAGDSLKATLQRKVALLKRGEEFLQSVHAYSGQFTRQELVGNELQPEQTMYLKMRHAPFSVYFRWLDFDPHREAIFVSGENEDKMVVHLGGWKRKLPALRIAPDSSLALAENRHPITEAGLLKLTQKMLGYHAIDLKDGRISRCMELDEIEFDGRNCFVFLVEYKSRDTCPEYRKSITLIDKEWNVPVCVKNYAWPTAHHEQLSDPVALDEATLVESYAYAALDFRQPLANADFDRTNPEYSFR